MRFVIPDCYFMLVLFTTRSVFFHQDVTKYVKKKTITDQLYVTASADSAVVCIKSYIRIVSRV